MPRNGDGLFRRRGIWCFKYKSGDGRYHEKSTGKRKKLDAQRSRSAFLQDLRDGELPAEMSKWTVEQALNEHVEHVTATRAKSSLAPERSAVKNLVRIFGKQTRLNSIANIQHFNRYQIVRRREGAGPKTINNELGILSRALQLANLWRRLSDVYKPLPVPETDIGTALTTDELARLIATAQTNPRWFVAWNGALLVANTGLRHKEIKTLRLSDVELDEAPPRITLRRRNTKNDASARVVPLNDFARHAAGELTRRARLLGAYDPEHFLLPANMGRHTKKTDPLSGERGYNPTRHQETWCSAWKSLKMAANLPRLRFHDLRHTFITHAREEGVDIEVVMNMVGHLSPKMTRYYTHLGTDLKLRAADKVQQRNSQLAAILGIPNAKRPDTEDETSI